MRYRDSHPDDRSSKKIATGPAGPADLYDGEIEALFRAEAHRLKGYLARLGADWSLIDDIIQDSFLVTRRRWADVRQGKHPKAYLYTVTTNRMHRLHRDRYARSEPHADPGEAAGAAVADDNATGDLDAAIRGLPRRQRETILLHKVLGFSIAETAAILQISEGSVKNYLCLGKRKLAEYLDIDLASWGRDER